MPSLPLLLVWPRDGPARRRAKFARPRIPSCALRRARWPPGSRGSPSPESLRSARRRTPASESGRSRCGWRAAWRSPAACSVQPVAPARPVIVNSACTPPSGVPSGFETKRASRTGPFAERNGRHRVGAAVRVANATCGFTAGLDAADRRLRVAAAAAIEVHARAEAFGDVFRFGEVGAAGVEVFAAGSGDSPPIGPPARRRRGRTPGSTALKVTMRCRIRREHDEQRRRRHQ